MPTRRHVATAARIVHTVVPRVVPPVINLKASQIGRQMQSSDIRAAFDRFSLDGATLDRHGFKCAFMSLHGSKPARSQWELCVSASVETASDGLASGKPSSSGRPGTSPADSPHLTPDVAISARRVEAPMGHAAIDYKAFLSAMQVSSPGVHGRRVCTHAAIRFLHGLSLIKCASVRRVRLMIHDAMLHPSATRSSFLSVPQPPARLHCRPCPEGIPGNTRVWSSGHSIVEVRATWSVILYP
jgi:hypothetical protein